MMKYCFNVSIIICLWIHVIICDKLDLQFEAMVCGAAAMKQTTTLWCKRWVGLQLQANSISKVSFAL